jgi:hypothetical protein
LVDKAFGSLDFITRSKITEKLGIGLVAKTYYPQLKEFKKT